MARHGIEVAEASPVPGRRFAARAFQRLAMAAACLALLSATAHAAPYIWDDNDDGMDDRIETVHLLGYEFSFVGADTLLPQRIQVLRGLPGLLYGVHVIYDHAPTNTDVLALTLTGMPVLYRYEALPALRSIGTWAQLQLANALPGVERIEAVPVLYSLLRDNTASIGVRDATERVFPTWEGSGGADGSGVVIAILDTGVNDENDGFVAAHEAVAGRFLGGAQFPGPDSTFATPRDGSMNPDDHGGTVTQAHATHVAGIALGTGGPSGFARGVAPGARFVDVKVLSDAGSGTGLAEALDWCIHNRTRDWGVAGYEGIDVINLSLGSADASDGNDLASRLAARAVELGIVVVASVGNDGLANHIPSPAAGDGVLAVGAYDSQRTPEGGDDQFASISNRGPRHGDGDLATLDELKPDLVAPGIAILSANGESGSDGHQYRRLNGTSMSAAFVSGAVACLRSADPSLSPAEIGDLLRATARRDLAGVPSAPPGADPRWQAARGFGAIDLYAAMLEAAQPELSQFARLELRPSANLASVEATLWTQRERGAAHFTIERAPDVGGAPGAFAALDSAAAAGDSSLADAANRHAYAFSWPVPPAERGVAFWYRAAASEKGGRHWTAARRFQSPSGPSFATLEWTVVHNAFDTDVTGHIAAGAPDANRLGTGPDPIVVPLTGTSAAVSSEWVDGASTLGNVAWTFRAEISDPAAFAFLPPTSDRPWQLMANEGGFVNRSGRVTSFKLTWHSPGGDDVYVGGPVPQQTAEGAVTTISIPAMAASVGPPSGPGVLRYGPNPVRLGGRVVFALGRGSARDVRVYDLAGREVGAVPFAPSADGLRAEWSPRDRAGEPLAPGVYLARAGAGPAVRVVLLPR